MASELEMLLGYGTLGGLALLILPRIFLCMFGFTGRGVRHSSYASGWQSEMGRVPSGSCFSCCQSCGAGGTPCGSKIGIFLFGFYATVVLIISHDLSYAPLPTTNFTRSWNDSSQTVVSTDFALINDTVTL